MIIYIHTGCSTCKKAVSFLGNNQIPVTIKDIVKEPPPISELERMLEFQKMNLNRLLNTSGLQYREMQLSQKLKEMPLSEILALLHGNGMLIKRPFLLGKDVGLTGFKEDEWLSLIL